MQQRDTTSCGRRHRLRTRAMATSLHPPEAAGPPWPNTTSRRLKRNASCYHHGHRKQRNGKRLRRSFVDVRKTYSNGVPTRTLHTITPNGLNLPKNNVWTLVRCMYGTRDAGTVWDDVYSHTITDPAVFVEPLRHAASGTLSGLWASSCTATTSQP